MWRSARTRSSTSTSCSGNILEKCDEATKRRYFASNNTGINEGGVPGLEQARRPCGGRELDDRRLKKIVTQPLSDIYVQVAQLKIEEMKDTLQQPGREQRQRRVRRDCCCGHRCLQEAGNKTSRDMISASYRADAKINSMSIERMRQFYDEVRSFRITGTTPGSYRFVDMNNAGLREQPMGQDSYGNTIFRRPVFDLKIKAQKKNPFSRMEQNERAKGTVRAGLLQPGAGTGTMGRAGDDGV